MKTRKLTAIILSVILCVGLMLSGCGKESGTSGKNNQAASGGKDPSKVWVLRVDDNDVYLNEVNAFALSFMEGLGVEADTDMTAYYSESYPTLDDAFKAQLLVQIRQVKILYNKAVERGLSLTSEEEAKVDELVTSFFEKHDSAEMMDKYGIDHDLIVKIYTEMQLIKQLESVIEEEAGFEETDYGTFYDFVFLTIQIDENGNGVLDASGNYVELSQEEKDAQKLLAEEVLARLQQGDDPQSLIDEYKLSATSGVVHATSDSLKETYGLKDGETSDIINNSFGYTIVQIVTLVDKDYTEQVNTYSESTTKSNAVDNQENEWYNSYNFSEDDLDNEVWSKFTFQDFV